MKAQGHLAVRRHLGKASLDPSGVLSCAGSILGGQGCGALSGKSDTWAGSSPK